MSNLSRIKNKTSVTANFFGCKIEDGTIGVWLTPKTVEYYLLQDKVAGAVYPGYNPHRHSCLIGIRPVDGNMLEQSRLPQELVDQFQVKRKDDGVQRAFILPIEQVKATPHVWAAGQVVKDSHNGRSARVIAVLGDAMLLSSWGNTNYTGSWYTFFEADTNIEMDRWGIQDYTYQA